MKHTTGKNLVLFLLIPTVFTFLSQVSCFERMWQSDSLLEECIASQLKHELSSLTPCSQDASQEHIIDPVPYCLIYNKTLVSHLNGKVYRAVPPPPSQDVCPNFALLPSDVFVPPDTSAVRFVSYINNLHPDLHKRLYALLERILTGFLPLFEHTLTDLHRNNPVRLRILGSCKYTVWEEPEPPEDSDDEEGWEDYRKLHRKWSLNRPLALPDVPPGGYPGGIEARRHKVTLRGQTIQVFVRVSTISLVGICNFFVILPFLLTSSFHRIPKFSRASQVCHGTSKVCETSESSHLVYIVYPT